MQITQVLSEFILPREFPAASLDKIYRCTISAGLSSRKKQYLQVSRHASHYHAQNETASLALSMQLVLHYIQQGICTRVVRVSYYLASWSDRRRVL
jgi:hypothetical protein